MVEIQPVDVAKIVAEVKDEIARSYEPEELKSFEDVDLNEVMRSVDPGLVFSHQYFQKAAEGARKAATLVYYHGLQGSAPAQFMKKVVRKLARGVVEPLCDQQNDENSNLNTMIQQLYLRTNDQQREIDCLRSEVDRLKAQFAVRTVIDADKAVNGEGDKAVSSGDEQCVNDKAVNGEDEQ